jgi:Ala-tRNA(Pro) deacylase
MSPEAQSGGRGVDLVVGYLEERGVAHDVIDHEQTFSAMAEAKAAEVPPEHAAKSVLLREGEEYRLAVIPASERLDLRKARAALQASGQLRLANESEMAADFGSFDVGAVPPLGPMLPAPEVIDPRLLVHDRILCSGGDHRHSLLIDPKELSTLADARVADVCKEESAREELI